MDPQEDRDYMHIAKEGLKAPLPPPWKACKTNEGEIYYFDPTTGHSQWEHPMDDHFKQKYLDAKEKSQKSSAPKFKLPLPIASNSSQVSQTPNLVLNKNPSQSNIRSSGNLEASAISALSYSYNTGFGENASDINKKTEPDNPNNIAMEIARDELNESLEFSNFDDESKSKSSPARKPEDIDSEYRKKLQKVEEDLETKFATILADLETQYQNEAHRLQNNLDIELKV